MEKRKFQQHRRHLSWPPILGKPEATISPNLTFWLVLSYKHGVRQRQPAFFVKQIMQMNVLASTVLFLLIGPFDFVSSWEVESTGKFYLFRTLCILRQFLPARCFVPNSNLQMWKRKHGVVFSDYSAFNVNSFLLYFRLWSGVYSFPQ